MVATGAGLVIDGWVVAAHPLFLSQVEALISEVEKAKASNPDTYRRKPAAKRLAAIRKLAFTEIPSDLAHPKYRLGTTMGADYRYWRRAKFFERYRLFFRYKEADRLIVLVWVNDGSTLRERGARNDVYNVFKKMLGSGTPPSTWSDLVAECQRLRPF